MEAELTPPPTEEQSSPAPEPMTMERTNSSEMGSDSSVSTEYYTKDVASNSSRSEVESESEDPAAPGTPTPRSPSDREEATRLLSPAVNKGDEEQKAAPETEKKNDKAEPEKATKAEPEKRNALPIDIAKGVAKDQAKGEVKDQAKAAYLAKKAPGSDAGPGAGPWTGSGPTIDGESKYSDYTCPCSSCCQNCTPGGVIFNVLACICFPVTIGQMAFTGVCCKCPRLIASVVKQTGNSAKSRLSKGKSAQQGPGTEGKFSSEHSDLEEPEEGSSAPKPTKSEERSNDNEAKNRPSANVLSKSGSETASKPPPESTKNDEGGQDKVKAEAASGIENPTNLFFPSPESADDRPGGDKPGGR